MGRKIPSEHSRSMTAVPSPKTCVAVTRTSFPFCDKVLILHIICWPFSAESDIFSCKKKLPAGKNLNSDLNLLPGDRRPFLCGSVRLRGSWWLLCLDIGNPARRRKLAVCVKCMVFTNGLDVYGCAFEQVAARTQLPFHLSQTA